MQTCATGCVHSHTPQQLVCDEYVLGIGQPQHQSVRATITINLKTERTVFYIHRLQSFRAQSYDSSADVVAVKVC